MKFVRFRSQLEGLVQELSVDYDNFNKVKKDIIQQIKTVVDDCKLGRLLLKLQA